MPSARHKFDAQAQNEDVALSSLKKIFTYVAENIAVIDDALIPPFQILETIHHSIDEMGLKGLRASDGEVILKLATGLQMLSADSVPGYYNQDDFERATLLAQKIAQGMTP